MKKAILALADGTIFEGYSCGADGSAVGEVVFNTSMCGYQEMLTDPSNHGQIVALTYTEIGNYGINPQDMESSRPWVQGIVVRKCSEQPSNWRATMSLGEYLRENGIPAIEGVDTRMLTRHVRYNGTQAGVITSRVDDPNAAVQMAREAAKITDVDYVMDVTHPVPRRWIGDRYEDSAPVPERQLQLHDGDGAGQHFSFGSFGGREYEPHRHYRVVCVDCGVKQSILRCLHQHHCDVITVPADSTAAQILAWNADGVVFSNGPGDPEVLDYLVNAARELLGQVPIFGIGLGHQILGRALGGRTFKLKAGHRGSNHPVKSLLTEHVDITYQNHGFCVDIDSLPKADVEVTHVSLNDGTCEGLRHRELPVFGVQHHPEAAPGPHDSDHLFDDFIALMAGQ